MPVTVEGPNEGQFRWTVIVSEQRSHVDLRGALDDVVSRGHDGGVQLWIRDVDAEADAIALDLGFQRYRDLWQLRCALPNRDSHLETRGFTADDIDDFIRVNNRAFDWHPEQGGLTRSKVEATMAEPWFDADGFRLLHEDGDLVGFCWTKIHHATNPRLGEIYVIAIDPSHHGLRLGKPMTLAGLEWLAAQGLEQGMLYVESDNDPANATYAAIGFTRHHTDRAYEFSGR